MKVFKVNELVPDDNFPWRFHGFVDSGRGAALLHLGFFYLVSPGRKAMGRVSPLH